MAIRPNNIYINVSLDFRVLEIVFLQTLH